MRIAYLDEDPGALRIRTLQQFGIHGLGPRVIFDILLYDGLLYVLSIIQGPSRDIENASRQLQQDGSEPDGRLAKNTYPDP